MAEEAKKLTELVKSDASIPVDVKKQLTDWLKAVADISKRPGPEDYHYFGNSLDPGLSINTDHLSVPRLSSSLAHHPPVIRSPCPFSSRPWRSHSLTPPCASGAAGGGPTSPVGSSNTRGCSSSTEFRHFNSKKRRSNSLTPRPNPFEDHPPPILSRKSNLLMMMSSSNSDLHHLQQQQVSGGLSCEDIALASSVKLQPGMKEVKEWLKSLRLHKYTTLLESMSYDEMLSLTEKSLEEREVTLGARGKILKSLQQVKDRPLIIKDLSDKLDTLSSKFDLYPILTELEFILLMPLKPTEGPSVFPGLPDASKGEPEEPSSQDIPGQLFELLSKINGHLRAGGDTMDAVTIFVCFLERCRKQEAFTPLQKQFFFNWIQKLRASWNPPIIKRVSDLNKRRFSRESLIRRSSIRSPTQLGVSGSYTPRGPSPISHYSPTMVVTTPTPPPMPHLESSGDLVLSSCRIPTINLPPEDPSNYGTRKSTPEMKSPTPGYHHGAKRIGGYPSDPNSMTVSGSASSLSSSPLIPDDDDDDDDSLGLMPNFVDPGLLPFQLSSSGFRSRRESAESRDSGYYLSLPDSRRNSSLSVSSSSDSRRESAAFSFDGSYFDGTGSCTSSRSSSFLLPSSATSPIYPHIPEHTHRREERRESSASSITSDYYYMDLRRDSEAGGASAVTASNFLLSQQDSLPSFVLSPSSPTPGSVSLSAKGPNSISSGCISDSGSTNSLLLIEPDLEQHMANISLSVTEQVLD